MIPASKNATFADLFARHARQRLHGAFHRVLVHGLVEARAVVARSPVLVVSNHTSWWDPLVALHLASHQLDADGYALMDAKNLRRLPFFGLAGAFGVDLDDPKDGVRAIRHAAALLDAPRRLVWIFPQGRERPVTERPLGFHGGAAAVERLTRRGAPASVLPIALRYEHGPTERPDVYVSIGAPVVTPIAATRGQVTTAHEEAVGAELGRIERAVRGDAATFEDLRGRAPPRDDLPTRALALLTRLALPAAGPPDRS